MPRRAPLPPLTVSKDTRVRADGFVKIMAIDWPLKGLKSSSRAYIRLLESMPLSSMSCEQRCGLSQGHPVAHFMERVSAGCDRGGVDRSAFLHGRSAEPHHPACMESSQKGPWKTLGHVFPITGDSQREASA